MPRPLVPLAEVDRACDALNAHTLTLLDLASNPALYIAVLRYRVWVALQPHLYRLHAAAARQPLLVWRSVDLTPKGGALPAEYHAELEHLRGPDNDGGVTAICAFFHGVRYNLTTTANPALHHVHNNTGTGTGLILDPSEPPIPSGTAVHVLLYPLCANVVKPDGLPLGLTACKQSLLPPCPARRAFLHRRWPSARYLHTGFSTSPPQPPRVSPLDHAARGDPHHAHTGGVHAPRKHRSCPHAPLWLPP